MTGPARGVLMVHPTADLYGSDRVFLESVGALVRAGRDVVVALPATGPLEQQLRNRGARVEICPSPVLRKSLFSPRGFLATLKSTIQGLLCGPRLIRRLGPDVIYVNTTTLPLWHVLAKLFGIPLLVHVHEGEASASAAGRMALAAPLLLATTVIANSRSSAGVIHGSVKRLGSRTTVVHNAVPGPVRPLPVRPALNGPVRLIYVGRLSPRKGVDVAISALALLEQAGLAAELDLVGAVFPGYEWYEKELQAQVAALGLGGKVHFHGFVTSVWDLVAGADMLVVPSRGDESFGNTAVEGILAGRPVIASNNTGLIEATTGYGAVRRVSPNDPTAIAAAVNELVRSWNDIPDILIHDSAAARSRHGLGLYQQRILEAVDGCHGAAGLVPQTLEMRMP